jgi:hypothetical protein
MRTPDDSKFGYGLSDAIIENTHKEINELRAKEGKPPIDWSQLKPKARTHKTRAKAAGAA